MLGKHKLKSSEHPLLALISAGAVVLLSLSDTVVILSSDQTQSSFYVEMKHVYSVHWDTITNEPELYNKNSLIYVFVAMQHALNTNTH